MSTSDTKHVVLLPACTTNCIANVHSSHLPRHDPFSVPYFPRCKPPLWGRPGSRARRPGGPRTFPLPAKWYCRCSAGTRWSGTWPCSASGVWCAAGSVGAPGVGCRAGPTRPGERLRFVGGDGVRWVCRPGCRCLMRRLAWDRTVAWVWRTVGCGTSPPGGTGPWGELSAGVGAWGYGAVADTCKASPAWPAYFCKNAHS